MDWMEVTLRRLAASLSHMLDPVALLLDRLGLLIRGYLDGFGLSYPAQSGVLTTLAMLVSALIVLSLTGWLRVVAVVVVAMVMAKMYGVLPGL